MMMMIKLFQGPHHNLHSRKSSSFSIKVLRYFWDFNPFSMFSAEEILEKIARKTLDNSKNNSNNKKSLIITIHIYNNNNNNKNINNNNTLKYFILL